MGKSRQTGPVLQIPLHPRSAELCSLSDRILYICSCSAESWTLYTINPAFPGYKPRYF